MTSSHRCPIQHGQSRQTGASLNISHLVNSRAPPRKALVCSGIEDREENYDACDRHGTVQCSAEDEIVLLPPSKRPLLYQESKNEAYDDPTAIICTCSRGQVVQSAEEKRDMAISPEAVGILALQ